MDELPRLSRTHRKAAIQVALWSTRWLNRSCQDRKAAPAARHQNRLSARAEGRFSMHPKGREGAAACPGPLKMHRVPQKAVLRTEYLLRTREGGFRYRISLPYQRSLFFTPGAPENAPRTTGACFLHRAHIPYHRRPSPVPNATNTTQSHPAAQTTASSTPSLRTSASWKPPGTRNNRFAEKPLQPFQKIAVTFTQFFYICAE